MSLESKGDRTPFPDVTGLRLKAPSRLSFAQSGENERGRASWTSALSVASVRQQADVLGYSATQVLQAAWGLLVSAYLQNEAASIELDVAGSSTSSLAMGSAICDVHDAQSVLSCMRAPLRPRAGIAGPVVYCDTLDLPRAQAWDQSRQLPPAATLALVPCTEGGNLELHLLAAPSIHSHGSAQMMLRQVDAVLSALLRGTDPLAMPLELQGLANPHPARSERDMPNGAAHERLEDQFRRRAQTMPDVVALECCTQTQPPVFTRWTYRTLDVRSDDIAQLLWSYGAGYAAPGEGDDVVALCVSKSMDMYAAILGILKAGASWCPIDPSWPPSRQAALLEKSCARVVLTAGDELARVREIAPPSLQVVALAERVAASPEPVRGARASPQQLAYKIWTSGTTGLPKAVGIEHDAAVQGMRALQDAVPTSFAPCTPGSIRYLQFAAYVFDLSIFDIFYTWGHGGTVCFAPVDLLLSNLVDVANALQVTHTLLTPAVSASVPRAAIPSMRVLINGGEKLSQVVADDWTNECRLVNIYGPAEATLSLTMRDVPRHDEVKSHNIGLTFPDATCVVLDAAGRVLPRGAVGELLLGGPQLARGYIGDPDKTRDKFVEHPELGRLYHTGDLARQLWDGQWEYLGRNDDQVKINGIRIELLEINAVVKAASDSVRDADTVAMEPSEPDLPPRIVAFAVAPHESLGLLRTDDDAVTIARQLRAESQATLPSYMVPAHFVILTHFPRTSSAKIDRRAVREAYQSLDLLEWEARVAGNTGASDEALSHPLGAELRARVAEMCGCDVDHVSAHTPFSLLGLHSVRAMALSARLMEAGWPVSALSLAKHDTIAKLVASLDDMATPDPRKAETMELRCHSTYADQVPYDVRQHARLLPTTSLQQGMLLETQADPASYWLFRRVPWRHAILQEQLVDVVRRVAQEYDCLRLGFYPVALPETPTSWSPLYVALLHDEPAVRIHAVHTDPVADLRPHTGDVVDGRPPWLLGVEDSGEAMVLAIHHALYDAPTLDMILARIDALCADATTPAPRVTPWPQVVAELAADSSATEASAAAWSAALRGVTADVAPWPELRTTRAAAPRACVRLARTSPTAPSALAAAAQKLGTEMRPLLQVAWARLLSLYLATPGIMLGDVVSLRSRDASFLAAGGSLLATLPVWIDVTSAPTWAALVQQVHATQASLGDVAAPPLAYIRELIQCPGSQPLFHSVMVMDVDDGVETPEHVLLWQHATDHGVQVEHTMALEVRLMSDDTLCLALNYDSACVDEAYAALMLSQLDGLLAAMLAAPERAVHDMPLPTTYDAKHLLRTLPPPAHLNVAEWAAAHDGGAVAVEMRHGVPARSIETLTYAELDERSAAVAAALASRVAAGTIVAVALPRSLDTYVCLLGLLRAGLVYLPLDESWPAERQHHLLRSSEAAGVVSWRTDGWPSTCQVWTPAELVAHSGDGRREVAPDSPAYLLYTSGSTGEPKGCLLSHANLALAIDSFRAAFDAAAPGAWAGARFLARSAEAFDVHLLECFLTLQVGATIVTMARTDLLADLGAAMADAQVSHACVVPSLFYTRGRRVVPSDVPSLRALIVGGEKLPDDVAEAWASSDVALLNAYGPTEATIGISCTPVLPTTRATDIGLAFPGNRFVVRTPERWAIPGEPGELCILGTLVGLGYLHRDSDAFFRVDGRRAYATGDRVRMRPDGHIEYLGRQDHTQVKVRGARVELGDVDAALLRAGARQAATLLLTHAQHTEPHLVAFVADSARASGAPSVVAQHLEAMHARLRASLSTYMVPSRIVQLSHLPLAKVSGKVDRRALAAVYDSMQLDAAATDDEPATPLEMAAARAVARTVTDVPIGVHTDLFGVGLDSLRAVRLAQALAAEGIDVPLAAVMSTPTIAGLLRAQRTDAAPTSAPPPRGRLPCLPLQTATLARSLADPAGHWYVNHVRVRLAATAHDERWAAVAHWRRVMARYAVYRTVFAWHDDRAWQTVLDTLPPIEAHVAAPWSEAAADRISDSILAELETRPPVRLTLFDDVLCVSLHHAVYDAASLELLLAAVGGADEPDTFHEVVQYAAATHAASSAYYAQCLEGMVHTPLPTMTGRYSERGASCSYTASSPLSLAALQAAAAAQKVTLSALVLHAYCRVLSQYVGEDEVTLGVILSGRMADVRHETAHGPCITTVPFRWRRDNVGGVHAQLAGALTQPFPDLVETARALRLDGALFDVLFSYMPATERVLPPGVTDVDDTMRADFALALQATPQPSCDTLAWDVTYAPDRLPRAQVEQLVAQLSDALGEVLGHVGGVPCRSVVHPQPVVPGDDDAFLALFSQHVATRPGAEAITFARTLEPFDAETLSYAQLDERAERYAAVLQECEGDAVFVHLPRSMDLYVVLLAVWKAHKTYVPLDPTLPDERLEYMASVVGRGTLVTTAPWRGAALPTVLLDELRASRRAAARRTPRLDVPAYILFTSGSTGRPKGVQISHRALAAAVVSWRAMLPHTPSSRLLQLASPGFDVSLFELCLPLGLGFAMTSAPKEVLLNDLEAAFRQLRVTMADLPAALAALVHPDRVPELEWLMSGGDVIDERVVRLWGAPPRRLINAYGPTEGTIGNTLGQIDATTRRSVVGDVYPASTIYICQGDELAYAGGVGEIVVGGPQVADGYVGAPDLTAAKFPELFGGRVYRSGDRGRLLCDGRIECLGRMERGQVKVNGQRVELEEIAHALAVAPGVADACVQYLQHPSHATKQLVAFLALELGDGNDAAASAGDHELALRRDAESARVAAECVAAARQHLAPYMVPALALVLRGRMPLTPNNKVDVKRLAALYDATDLRAWRSASAAPRQWSERARTYLAAVAAFVGVPLSELDVDASFYALGIDSLSALRLASSMREAGAAVTVSTILSHATPARLAAALEAESPDDADEQAYRALVASAAVVLGPSTWPCTPLQAGMLAHSTASHGAMYVHTHAMTAAADPARVAEAWRALVRHHPILRTTFHTTPSEAMPWTQTVHDELDAPVYVHATSAWSHALQEARSRLDVARAPHALHLRAAPHGADAVLVLHHALYDAHALGELLDDWDRALSHEALPPRPPLSEWLPHLCAGDQHVDAWLDTLRDYVPRALVAPGGSHESCGAETATPLRTSDAERLCQRLGVSMHAAATLAFAHLLAEVYDSADVCFGQVLSLRGDLPHATEVLGPALNTVPTRVTLQSGTYAAQLLALQRHIDATRAHRHAPLRAIAARHQRTHTSPAPLIDALLDVQRHEPGHAWRHLQLLPQDAEDDMQYALNVEVVQADVVRLVGTARTAFRDRVGLAQLLERLGAILTAILTHSDDTPALPSNAAPPAPRAAAEDAPRDKIEALQALVAQVAQVPLDDVEADTPLLALGLDSISAIHVVAQARERQLDVAASDLAAGTPRAAAAAWARRVAAAHDGDVGHTELSKTRVAETLGVSPASWDVVRPVAAGQTMHIATLLQSQYKTGLFSLVYRTETCLDVDAMRRAWAALQQRHELLRTTFAYAGTLVQIVVHETQALNVHAAAPDSRAQLDALCAERATLPADKPWAAADVVVGSAESFLVLTLFHAMYDAWTLPMLLDDLASLYRGATLPPLLGLAPLLALAPPSADDVRSVWGDMARVPPCLVAAATPAAATYTFAELRAVVPDVARLRAALAAHKLSLAAWVLAAWAQVLQRETRTPPVFGVYRAARSMPASVDLSRTAAPCLNMLPVAVPLQSSPHATAAGMAEHLARSAPLEHVALSDVHRALELPLTPRFNTQINVLWNDAAAHDAGMWAPVQGVGRARLTRPVPLAPRSALDGWPDAHCVAAQAVAIDAYVDNDGALSLALRCPASVWNAEQARGVLEALAAAVQSY